MNDRLKSILADKRQHIKERKSAVSFQELNRRAASLPPTRGFERALRERAAAGRYGLIAEIKRASPSKGAIRSDFDPPALARAYRDGGACCLSVLTDTPYFQGSDDDLIAVKAAVDLPILRKDFIIDAYQIAEARAIGADCILLIVAALTDTEAAQFLDVARSYGLDALMEVHDAEELARAIALQPGMIGINNRNLKTLAVDIETSLALARTIPGDILPVAESGLSDPKELAALAGQNVTTFLIGESLLRQPNVREAARLLLIDKP